MSSPGVLDLTTGEAVETGEGAGLGLAYAGVDPFCRIVPISTNFDPEPEQLVLSLLYAVLIRADVIVLARDFPSPASLAPESDPDDTQALSRALGVGLRDTEMELWALLDTLVQAIADRVPMICAAGNGAQATLLYPASLAAPGNGIVAVGARTAAGQPASYTPVSDMVTLYAPSGDGERLDAELQRVDTQAPGYDPSDHSAAYRDDLKVFDADSGAPDAHTFAPQDLVSTDVPGRAGYNSSPYADAYGPNQSVLDYRSAFCRFSGTSGAVAVTAGLVSLAVSAGRLAVGSPGDGAAAKALLTGGAASVHATAEPRLSWAAFSPPT
ncbi:S8 family serine peptidase [Pseudooceanicola sp. LIPI14-2-Ac024]|uniref:S8 family serine peptidase n=1 Tax=Pseudooceanicola sp. LIPI14-2-Ac024 TaxID=3344875 RepID=UPI0035D09E12